MAIREPSSARVDCRNDSARIVGSLPVESWPPTGPTRTAPPPQGRRRRNRPEGLRSEQSGRGRRHHVKTKDDCSTSSRKDIAIALIYAPEAGPRTRAFSTCVGEDILGMSAHHPHATAREQSGTAEVPAAAVLLLHHPMASSSSTPICSPSSADTQSISSPDLFMPAPITAISLPPQCPFGHRTAFVVSFVQVILLARAKNVETTRQHPPRPTHCCHQLVRTMMFLHRCVRPQELVPRIAKDDDSSSLSLRGYR